uniref:Adrenoceptor alpha 1B n=1 Tax=Eptatretus burgeri TaxID=7764 RepID=A0A8C4N726_EPTBU
MSLSLLWDQQASWFRMTPPRSATPRDPFRLRSFFGVFISFAIMGNVLVVLAVACNRQIRTVTNLFIINLACADLLLASAVLPFSATLEVLGYWVFGRIFCDVWAALDVLCCTASIMSLCAISIDRYIGVSFPLRYPTIVTRRRVLLVLLAVWIFSAVISIGPLLGWKEPAPKDLTVCLITEVPGYTLFSAVGSFYIPLCIILIMYCHVYVVAQRQTKILEEGIKLQCCSQQDDGCTLRVHRGHSTLRPRAEERATDRSSIANDQGQYSNKGGIGNHFRSSLSMRFHKLSREKKAAKTLGIVVGGFILCWLPFFITLPIGAFFPEAHAPEVLFKVVFWLGYFNSCINPIIYPCLSQEFKRAFLQVIRCRAHPRKRRPWTRPDISSFSRCSHSDGNAAVSSAYMQTLCCSTNEGARVACRFHDAASHNNGAIFPSTTEECKLLNPHVPPHRPVTNILQ